MATVALFDPNSMGPIEFHTDDTPEEVRDMLADAVGRWRNIPGVDGAVLLSDDWGAWYYLSDLDTTTDEYPDYIIYPYGVSDA